MEQAATPAYVIGIDYGTDSVRAVLIEARTGAKVAQAVHPYARWKTLQYCNPARNQFRQHPLDYIEGLEAVVRQVAQQVPPAQIEGLAVDTTGSTPGPVNKQGVALGLPPEFAENPNAQFVLWKDHTALEEAAEINHKARTWGGGDYTRFEGGIYSSEWFWVKIMHVLREDAAVAQAAYSWMEHCDWITQLLTGAAAWILAGGAHHTGYSQNLTVEYLEDFAEMAGIECVIIDADTKLRTFKNELRYNEVAYGSR